jgi:25S rRNA (uracil2634-N3)-methyltransferase
MEDNKLLVRRFVSNAETNFLKPHGEIHMCHKTKPPFNHWKLDEVALELCGPSPDNDDKATTTTTTTTTRLEYAGRMVLDRFLLPPYTPRKALDKKSFPCHDACFYIFQNTSSSANAIAKNPTTSQKGLCASTLPDAAVLVTPDLISRIRNVHLLQSLAEPTRQHGKQKKRPRRAY